MGPWSWGRYGNCKGLEGTLNKLANRGNVRTAVDQSPSHTVQFYDCGNQHSKLTEECCGSLEGNSSMVGDMTLGSQNRKEACNERPSFLGPKYIANKMLEC